VATLLGSFTRIDLADGVCVAMTDDTTVRVAPSTTAPQRADLAADVARLERGIADLTRERDQYRGLALATAQERDQRTSELSVAQRRCAALTAEADACARDLADLRAAVIAAAEGVAPDVSRHGHHVGRALAAAAQLHREAAHRVAGDGVDLARYVLRSEVVAALEADALDTESAAGAHTSTDARKALGYCAHITRGIAARFRGDLRSEAVEGGEQQAVKGGEGHGSTVATADSAVTVTL